MPVNEIAKKFACNWGEDLRALEEEYERLREEALTGKGKYDSNFILNREERIKENVSLGTMIMKKFKVDLFENVDTEFVVGAIEDDCIKHCETSKESSSFHNVEILNNIIGLIDTNFEK
ncbi:MAG: hypothetical protein N4A47_07055 [Clostridia bacterium]|jgi:hypothetical protein|nr:hypothetical protein [Clostridia bacterium]